MKEPPYHLCFETLGNELRVGIIKELAAGERSVSQLVKGLKAEQSRVSHNLALLRKCRVVESRVRGKERIYSLSKGIREKLAGGKNVFDVLLPHIIETCRKKGCEKVKE